MRVLPHYFLTASLMARALSQTPPGTLPSTNANLAVNYASTKVTPSIELPLSSKFFPSQPYSTDILTFFDSTKGRPDHHLPFFHKPNISTPARRPFDFHRYPKHLNACPWRATPTRSRYIQWPYNPPPLLADRSHVLAQRHTREHYITHRFLPAASAATGRYSPHIRILSLRAETQFRATASRQPLQRRTCEQGQ